jgi:hypothetical protein
MRPQTDPEPIRRHDARTLRLFDLEPYECIVVRCEYGRSTDYRKGFLQRHQRVPSDTLVYDLQFRLRCTQCNRTKGFGISIRDGQNRGTASERSEEWIIVPKGE